MLHYCSKSAMTTEIAETKTRSQFAHMLHASLVPPPPRPPRKPKPNADGSSATPPKQSAPTRKETAGGKSDSSQKQTKWSFSSLLDEACRIPEASKHVPVPQEPEWIMGDRDTVEHRAFAYEAQATRIDGKHLQCTSPVMNAIVISLERDLIEFFPAYAQRCLAHMIDELGERVLGAVIHDDEAQPHIHIFAVPNDGEEFGAVHPGYLASRTTRRNMPKNTPKSGTVTRLAYTKAMIAWQDRFHAGTKIEGLDLERTGPKRKRMDRNVYLIYKDAKEKAALATAETMRAAEAARAQSKEMLALARELMDSAQASTAEAEVVTTEAGLARTRNFAEAKAVAGERDKLAVTTAGEFAAVIAKLQADLVKERAAHSETKKALDDMKFKAKVVEDKNRIETVAVQVDASGRQIMPSETFGLSPARATMRKPKPGAL